MGWNWLWSVDEAENVVETQALAMGVLSKDGVLASALAVRSGRDVLGREEVNHPDCTGRAELSDAYPAGQSV